jgi:mRNA interferase MazF
MDEQSSTYINLSERNGFSLLKCTIGGPGYAGKLRPAVVVQEDRFEATGSVTLCAFTTDPTHAPLMRLVVTPTARNGLKQISRLMVDKITMVRKVRLGDHIGRLDDGDLMRLNRAMTVFLGLAS